MKGADAVVTEEIGEAYQLPVVGTLKEDEGHGGVGVYLHSQRGHVLLEEKLAPNCHGCQCRVCFLS